MNIKNNVILGSVIFILSACGNIPGQQLCICTDDDYTSTQQTPPTNVPPPPVISEGQNSSINKSQTKQTENKNIYQQQIAVGHVYPLSSTVAVCDLSPSNSNSCECWKHKNKTPFSHTTNTTNECRFDSMPINPNMSQTEKLNRTR